MADEQTQTAGNSQEVSSGSASAETQNVSTQPPAGESPVVENSGNQEHRIPKSRFDQVIEQRNREREIREQYESRIRELESARQGPAQKDVVETVSERLAAKLGLKPEATRELMEATREVAQAERAQVEQMLHQSNLGRWQEGLAQKYKDYQELSPKMAQVWDSLSPYEQKSTLASPRGLEMFYHYVKGMSMPDMVENAKSQAAQQAYNNKLTKQAVTSMPGASNTKPGGALTREGIRNMSTEEYMKRLPEINEAVNKGLIK